MTGQAPQTIEQINNTAPLAGPPPSWVPSDPNSLADTGALQDLGRYMAAGGATAPRDRRQPGEPISLDEFIANRQKLADQQLTTYFREAAKADPRVAGEAQRLAVDLNANPIEVERQLPQMRQILAERDAEQRAAAVQSPTLRRQLSDPHFARIAQDQVEPLGFFDGLYKNWRAGQLTVEQGALGDKFRRGIGTNSDFASLQYLEKELASLPARSGGPLDGLFRYAGQFSVTLPKAVAVGAMSGAAAALAGQFGPQIAAPEEIVSVPTAFTVGMLTEVWAGSAKVEAGSMYLDMVRDGFDKNTAANVSGIVGIASGALEVVGFGAMAAPAKKALIGEVKRKVSESLLKPTMAQAGKEFAKGYGTGTLGEIGTEVLQTVNEIVARELARPDGEKRANFDEITTQLADTIVETAKGMALLGAAAPGFKFAADRRAVLRAQEQQQTIAQFVTRAAEVAPEWKARNPEAFEASLAEMAKENGAEVFYVDGKKLGEILRQQDKAETDAGKGLTKSIANQIDDVVPGFSEQLAEAERTGGDVQIPSATFVAKLGDTPLAAQLAPHMRLDPETMSAFEIAEAVNNAKVERDGYAGAADGVRGERSVASGLLDEKWQQFAQSATKVEAGYLEAIEATKTVDTKTARAQARLLSAFVETQAERMGTTPEDFAGRFKLSIVPGVLTEDAAAALRQEGKDQPRAAYDPSTFTMMLFGGVKADPTSFLHESGHFFMHAMEEMARTATDAMSEQVKAEWTKALDALGTTEEKWAAADQDTRRRISERFSYTFEEYLASGEAPSAELRGLFSQFRTWMVRVYGAVRDALNVLFKRETKTDLPALTPDLRGVFDRMLASQEAIDMAAAERQQSLLFLDEKARKAAGITDEQWAEVQRLDAEARDAAVADLTAKAVRSMGVFEGARMRVVRELQSKLADTRAKVKAEVEAEVDARPVQLARTYVASGTVVQNDGTEVSAKLDTDAVRSILGADAEKLAGGLTRKGGMSPDFVAQMFGYQNGEQMLRDFLNSPSRDEAVQQRTDERMQAEHSDLTDPKAVRRAIESAMHTTAREKVIATELRQLLKSTQSTAALIAAAKEAARRALLRMEVGRISPRAFVKAEARAAKEAREALAKGDVQEAIAAQRRYLFQHELTRQSLDVQREIDKFVDATDSRYFATDDKVLKARNLDVVQAARSILGEYGLASGRQFDKTLRYLDVLRTQNPELHAELVALVSDVSAEAKDWRSTSLEQFRVMVNAVESLWDRAKRSNEIDVNGKRMARADVLDELRAASQKRYGEKPQPVRQDTVRARAAASVSGIGALLKRVEHWADWVDGGNGPWTRYVVRPMMKRFDDYMASREKRVKALRDIIKGLDLKNEIIDASEFLGSGVEFVNTAELLGAMLHMGNASNLQKLLGGNRWAAQSAEGEFDTRGWWRLIDHLIQKERITKAHMDALQQMWDLMEDLKGEAQKVNRDLYGTYFEEIQAQPFDTPWGRYRGGYAPATPDPTKPENADLAVREGLDAIQDAERNFRESMPSAGRGFTKTRNAATRPLTLDVRLVGKHVDQVLRFVHMQPSLRDVASLLRDRELAGYLNAADPSLINGVLVPWLERAAANRTAQRGKSAFLDGLFAWMRRAAGAATMFGNVTNAAQNVTGLSNAMVYVKRRHLVGAMWTGWTRNSAQEAAKLSKFMDQRLNSQIGQLQDDIDLALDPSAWGRMKEWTNRHGYFLQRMVQNRVDPIVWWGAFNQTLEESGSTMDDAAAVQRAVDEADAVVRKSQGSQRAIDVAAYEAGTPFARLFTQFSGYFNTVANQVASQRGASAKAVAAVHAMIFPTFVAGVIAAALNGRDDIEDKDGDGYSDEYAAWFFAQQIRGAAGLVPGFGPNVVRGLAAWGAVPGMQNPGNRLALAPAFSMVESFYRVGGDVPKVLTGQATAGQVRDFWTVLSLSGVPVAPIGRLQSMFMDEER